MIKMSESEKLVMKVIWNLGKPVTPNEVIEHFDCNVKWKYNTVRTFLARLTMKGLLECEPGRVNIYQATVTEKEYRRTAVKGFLKLNFDGSLRNMMEILVKSDVTKEQFEKIMEQIDLLEDD